MKTIGVLSARVDHFERWVDETYKKWTERRRGFVRTSDEIVICLPSRRNMKGYSFDDVVELDDFDLNPDAREMRAYMNLHTRR